MCNVAIGKYYYLPIAIFYYHIMCGGNIQICTYILTIGTYLILLLVWMVWKNRFIQKKEKPLDRSPTKRSFSSVNLTGQKKKSKWIPFALDDDGIEYKNRKRRTHISAQIFKLFGSILYLRVYHISLMP